MSVKYRFILGLGRSGTTLLETVASFTCSQIKLISEPLPKIRGLRRKKISDPSFCSPFDPDKLLFSCEILKNIFNSDLLLNNPQNRIIRSDINPDFCVVKEVHALFAFPVITQMLNAKAVIITRDSKRVIDSYFKGHTKNQRKYLKQEIKFTKMYLSGKFREKFQLLDDTLLKLNPEIISYIKKPALFTSEILMQYCITEIIKTYLITCAENYPQNFLHIQFETLCTNPIEISKKVYDFLNLDFNEEVQTKIHNTTTSSSNGYYDVAKNSRKILNQDFSCLSSKTLKQINRLESQLV